MLLKLFVLTKKATKDINEKNEKILNKQNSKKIIIVEGYFDVIKLEQFGFSNCLAPLGTSINHEKLIDLL